MRPRLAVPALLTAAAVLAGGASSASAAPALHGADRLLRASQVPGYALIAKPAAVRIRTTRARCAQPVLPASSLAVAEEFALHAKGSASGDYLGEILFTTPSVAAAHAFLLADEAVVKRCGTSPQVLSGYALGAVRVRRAPVVEGSPASFEELVTVPRQRGIAGGTLTVRLYEAGRRVVLLLSSHATTARVGGAPVDTYGTSVTGDLVARAAAVAAVANAATG